MKTILAVTVAVCLTSTAAFAQTLIGSQVVGSFPFSGGPNQFALSSGDVPAGYGNSTGQPVTITAGIITFGASGDSGFLNAVDFTATTMTVSESVPLDSGEIGWTMTFTDPAFGGITKVSDNFPNGGTDALFSGDTITLQDSGGTANGEAGRHATTFTATYDIAVVPEPSTIALCLFGASAFLIRRRK